MARAQRRDRPATPERLFWRDGFLAPSQCAEIVAELEFAFWAPSTLYVQGDTRRQFVRSEKRASWSTSEPWFSAPLRRTIAAVDRRIGRLLPEAPSRREPWQATRYDPGGRFGFHQDSGAFGAEPAGERTHTVLIYLEAPGRGGTTRFPLLDLDVECEIGRLLVWRNLDADGDADPEMLHAAMPVREGRKTILVTWIRQRALPASERGRRTRS